MNKKFLIEVEITDRSMENVVMAMLTNSLERSKDIIPGLCVSSLNPIAESNDELEVKLLKIKKKINEILTSEMNSNTKPLIDAESMSRITSHTPIARKCEDTTHGWGEYNSTNHMPTICG